MVPMSSSPSPSSLLVFAVAFLDVSDSGLGEGPFLGSSPSSSSSSFPSILSDVTSLQGQLTLTLVPPVIGQVAQFQCSFSLV